MIKVIILTINEYYMDWDTCLMITIYSHIQIKLVDKVIVLEGNILWRNGQSINRRYKLQRMVKNEFDWWFNCDTNLYVMQGWRVGIRDSVSRAKLGEGQLVCAEAPMLEWRNFLWIQLEESWSCMVFIVESINLSKIILWRWWIELEAVFIHWWRFNH
jgi:hypothetical protein